jgi:2,5-diamino-6-(ribosylamino)-4(3H)-pyrimidinone 5'-phosphate reductase
MLPKVLIHNAVSVDGRIDWFTPDVGAFYELVERWKEDATLAGSDTILAAPEYNPDPDDEHPASRQRQISDTRPLLVIPDSQGRVRNWSQLLDMPFWRDGIALCSQSTPLEYREYLRARDIEFIVAGEDRVDLRQALEQLNTWHGVEVVRVDSGGILNGALLRAGLVSEISLLVHPSLVGGVTPRSFFHAPDLESSDDVIELELTEARTLVRDIVWLRYKVL